MKRRQRAGEGAQLIRAAEGDGVRELNVVERTSREGTRRVGGCSSCSNRSIQGFGRERCSAPVGAHGSTDFDILGSFQHAT